MARPSDYTPETAAIICERVAAGVGMREICRAEGMPEARTVYRWLEANDEFRQQYARAKEAQADHFAEEILEISDDGSNDWMKRQSDAGAIEVPDHEHISRSKLRVDSRKWLMSKLAPKKYGDKLDHTIAGPDGGPVQVIRRTIVDPNPGNSNR